MLIDKATSEAISANGWVSMPSDLAIQIPDYAKELGQLVPSYVEGEYVDHLELKTAENAPRHSLSGMYGMGAFPFHTDYAHRRMPPRYVLLRSIGQSEKVRPTLLLDFNSIKLDPGQIDALRRDVWIVNGGREKFLSTVLAGMTRVSVQFLRFDTACMRPAHSRFESSASILRDAIAQASPMNHSWDSGEMLIFDNWRMLHARPEEGDHIDDGRILERSMAAYGSEEGDELGI